MCNYDNANLCNYGIIWENSGRLKLNCYCVTHFSVFCVNVIVCGVFLWVKDAWRCLAAVNRMKPLFWLY